MVSRFTSLARIAGAVGLSLALSLGAGSAFADDDDPEAYLYAGTCADLENATVVDEIDDLDDDEDDVREHWEHLGNGQDMPDGLMAEEDDIDDIDGGVQALVDGDYAVVVHETESTSSAVLVCGDIEGTVENDSLLIELDEVDGSGFEGRAFIHPEDDDDDDDDELEFVVGIYPAGSVDRLEPATPES